MIGGISTFLCNNAHIFDNIINCSKQYGIELSGDFHLVENNSIMGDMTSGILVDGDFFIIKNNMISGGIDGLQIRESSQNNEIKYNIISGNMRGISISSDGLKDKANIIIYNEFSENEIGVDSYYSRSNIIGKNNFIENQISASFVTDISFFTDKWLENYWDDWLGTGPYLIKGYLQFFSYYLDRVILIKMRKYDWNPAEGPYDINITSTQGCGIE